MGKIQNNWLQLTDDLASTNNGLGASMVSVEDTAGNFTSTNTEGVLAELSSNAGQVLFDAIVAPSGGDYTDLQSAITAQKTSIFIRDGEYTMTGSNVIVNTDAVRRIVGESREGVKFVFDANNPIFDIDGTLVTAAGTVDMTNASRTVAGNAGYDFSSVAVGDFFKLGSILYQDYGMYEISAKSGTTLTLASPFRGVTGTNLVFEVIKPVKGLTIENIGTKRTYNYPPGWFLDCQYGYKINLNNIHMDKTGGLSLSTFTKSSQFVVKDCSLDGDHNAQVLVSLGAECGDFSIINNDADNMGTLTLNNYSSFGMVANNRLSGAATIRLYGYRNSFIGNQTRGMSLWHSSYAGITSDNTFDGGSGINAFSAYGSYSQITGNTILNSTADGIKTDTNTGPIIISNNVIKDAALKGIYSRSGHHKILGNHVYSCGDHGIQGASYDIITDNVCRLNTGYGVNVAGNYCHVTNNNLLDNTTAAVNDTLGTSDIYENKLALTGAVSRIDSIAKSGSSEIIGDVTLSQGANITLTQVNNDIEVAVADNVVQELSVTTGIDGKAIAATTIYTVPSGKTAFITGAIVEATTATSITADATAGIGVAAGEDDIFGSEELIQIRTTGDLWSYISAGKLVKAASTEVIKLGIDTGATGTTLTFTVRLIGYLE